MNCTEILWNIGGSSDGLRVETFTFSKNKRVEHRRKKQRKEKKINVT